ncbi:glycosyl hydrolase family 18 protein [Cohnella sp.]|uniref:glycosyl hydrolase family 18 protein n=1 Tax=Cohnella sp. TaxID=1883426 RepID=UPI003566B513
MNKRLLKSFLILLLTFIGFSTVSMPYGSAESVVRVTYNDQAIVFGQKPISRKGTTYAETRPFIKPLGFQIHWINNTKFRLSKTALVIDMEVNSMTAYVNSRKVTLAAAPMKVGATLFLPLRPIADITGHKVSWNAATNTIAIESSSANNTPATSYHSYKIIAYYSSWGTYQNYDVSGIDASKITHINYAFANIKEGKIVLGDPWADTQKPFPGDCSDNSCLKGNFNQLQKLKKANPHLKTLISVGGWTWSGQFSDIALTASSRAKFADSAVQFIRDYSFDGVDLDWEYPVSGGLASNTKRPSDKQNFTLFLKEIREKLNTAQKEDGKTYLLTIAGGAFPGYVQNTEMDQIAKHLDWVNLMTYDFHGDWENVSNHQAPLYMDPKDPVAYNAKGNINSTIYTYLKAGIPANKLILGIPLYGRSWTGCDITNQGLYQSCKGVADGVLADGIHEYGNLENQGWINGKGFVRYWSNTAKVPWLLNKSTGTFITYEDPESIAYKAKYIKSKGLGGAMFWEINQDFNHTLQSKLYQSLK